MTCYKCDQKHYLCKCGEMSSLETENAQLKKELGVWKKTAEELSEHSRKIWLQLSTAKEQGALSMVEMLIPTTALQGYYIDIWRTRQEGK